MLKSFALNHQSKMLRVLILSVLCSSCLGFVARPLLPDHRIVGGENTTISAHPHQVSVQLYGSHYCGGSIINASWVVTAGHCAGSSAEAYTISVGSADRYGGIIHTVKRVIRHPKYNAYTIDYDIALLEINGTLRFNNAVNSIKLASVELPANTTVNVTGWGAVSQGGPSSRQLLVVKVPITDRKYCADAYAYMNEITPRMICAGIEKGGKDACQGDSGGPLTKNGTLYGIVSWGYGCAQPRYPGVYSNVADLRPWIKNVTGI